MATDASIPGHPVGTRPRAHSLLGRWTAEAWGAIAVTALFVGVTCWWLTQDRSIPIFDAGFQLRSAFEVHHELSAGHLLKALTLTNPYPPFTYLVSSIGIALGGVGVAPPIVAQNLVFLPLLALGCFHVARLAFDRTAGLLAVVFALGSPLIMAQFHVFMTDAPATAMVAVSVWAIIATEGFSRVGVSALAGLAVGLGMLTKEPFAFFVAGVIVVTALRGGRQAWRGLLVFAGVALVMALPWYVDQLAQIETLGSGAINTTNLPAFPGDIAPARVSIDNFGWYFWNFINFQLYLPLFAFAAIGWLWTMVGFARRRPVSRLAPELAIGSLVAWFAITETFVHDTRYSMPMLVYLAVFGAGWIVRLPRRPRAAATAALVLTAVANTLGASFGVGGALRIQLPGANTGSVQNPGILTVYSNAGFLVAGPRRDGDMLATLRGLRRNGVHVVVWPPPPGPEPYFSTQGLVTLAQIAGIDAAGAGSPDPAALTRQDAVLSHGPIEAGATPPCVRLSDGTGVWIRLGNPNAPGALYYCPSRNPQFYGP
jgi:hypothetical protein